MNYDKAVANLVAVKGAMTKGFELDEGKWYGDPERSEVKYKLGDDLLVLRLTYTKEIGWDAWVTLWTRFNHYVRIVATDGTPEQVSQALAKCRKMYHKVHR